MSKLKNPCLNCSDRNSTCHANCQKYEDFEKQNKELKAFINKQKQAEYDWYNFNNAKFKRINKRK